MTPGVYNVCGSFLDKIRIDDDGSQLSKRKWHAPGEGHDGETEITFRCHVGVSAHDL